MKLNNEWDVYKLELGTLLYRAFDSTVPDNMEKFGQATWFGTFKVAAEYAFSNRTQGEEGKVLTFMVNKPLYLLDMKSTNNFKLIYDKELAKNIPLATADEDAEYQLSTLGQGKFRRAKPGENVLEYAFNYDTNKDYNKIGRLAPRIESQSLVKRDVKLINWLCSERLEGVIDGWAHENIGSFSSEVAICDPDNYLIRTPIEYRFKNNLSRYIIKTENGTIVDLIDNSRGQIRYRTGLNMYNVVSYNPDPNKQSDRWLFQEIPQAIKEKYKLSKYELGEEDEE